MSRSLTKTVKVKTDQGSIFTHLEFDCELNVTGLWVSMQQKKRDTQVEDLVNSIIDAIHDSISEVNNAKSANSG
jgi:hypothetical protein